MNSKDLTVAALSSGTTSRATALHHYRGLNSSGKFAHVTVDVAESVTEHLAYQYLCGIDLAGRAATFIWCAL